MTPLKTVIQLTLLSLLVFAASAKPKPNAEAEAPHSLECSGSTSSSCDGKLCTVVCSDGNKVDLECEGESVNVNSNQVAGRNFVQIGCGSIEDLPKFAPCFPFCSNTGQSNGGQGNIEESNLKQSNIEQSNIEQSNNEQSNIEESNIEESNIGEINIGENNIDQ